MIASVERPADRPPDTPAQSDLQLAAEYHNRPRKSRWLKNLLIIALLAGGAAAGLGAASAAGVELVKVPGVGKQLDVWGKAIAEGATPYVEKLSEKAQPFLQFLREKYEYFSNRLAGVSASELAIKSPSDLVPPPIKISTAAALGTAGGVAAAGGVGLGMTGKKDNSNA